MAYYEVAWQAFGTALVEADDPEDAREAFLEDNLTFVDYDGLDTEITEMDGPPVVVRPAYRFPAGIEVIENEHLRPGTVIIFAEDQNQDGE